MEGRTPSGHARHRLGLPEERSAHVQRGDEIALGRPVRETGKRKAGDAPLGGVGGAQKGRCEASCRAGRQHAPCAPRRCVGDIFSDIGAVAEEVG